MTKSTLSSLDISPDLFLPLNVITETIGILATKGRGKTYTASVLSEEFLNAGQQVVAFDPTGAWWGLQSSANGRKGGIRIPIFGGEFANVPLVDKQQMADDKYEAAGEQLAQRVLERGFSAILDFSNMRLPLMKRFMTGFLYGIYEGNREHKIVHLMLDEADLLAPQKGGEKDLLDAMQNIVRRGRIKGIGSTLISQRPAVISKDVLTQCSILAVLGMGHPRDIEPIRDWASVHGTEEQVNNLAGSLPTLPKGTAWIFAPSMGLLQKVGVRQRITFDSSFTPEPGVPRPLPKKRARIDVSRLGPDYEKASIQLLENDPVYLKGRIADLEAKLDGMTEQLRQLRSELPSRSRRSQTISQPSQAPGPEEPVEVNQMTLL